VVLTETVSPGAMITVNYVEVDLSRPYSCKVYRDRSKTLSPSWHG
jgi:hypothetical protein